jgi:hypothetical protein
MMELMGNEFAYNATLKGLSKIYSNALKERDLELYQNSAIHSIRTYEECHLCGTEECSRKINFLLEKATRLESRLIEEVATLPTEEEAA